MPRPMDVETWPSFLLRLLGRVLKQGATFLEQQGQTLIRVAEQWADHQSSNADSDSQSESADEDIQNSPSSSEKPPEHWLKTIQESEGPLQWIDHTDENVLPNAPQRSTQSSPSSDNKGSISSREDTTNSSFSPPYWTSGKSPKSSSEFGESTKHRSRRDLPEGSDFPDSEGPTQSRDRERVRERRTDERAGSESERATGPPSSASASGGTDSRTSAASPPSGPVRLRPSATNHPAQKGEATDPDAEPVDQTISRSAETRSNASSEPDHSSSNGGKTDASPSADTTRRTSAVSSDFKSETRENAFGPGRRSSGSSSLSEGPSTDRPGSLEKQVNVGGAWRAPAVPSPQKESMQREGGSSDRSSPPVDSAETKGRPDSGRSIEHQKGNVSTDQSSHPAWPTLPEVEEIIEEEASEPRAWKRELRERERRRRLNREQRGELWSE